MFIYIDIETIPESTVPGQDWIDLWYTFGNAWRSGVWYDITAWMEVIDNTTGTWKPGYEHKVLHELLDDITITFDLPSWTMPAGFGGPESPHTAFLHMAHTFSTTGERLITRYKDLDKEVYTGTWKLRYFSTYTLIYGWGGPAGRTVPYTGDNSTTRIIIWGSIAVVTLGVAVFVSRRRKKEKNAREK